MENTDNIFKHFRLPPHNEFSVNKLDLNYIFTFQTATASNDENLCQQDHPTTGTLTEAMDDASLGRRRSRQSSGHASP